MDNFSTTNISDVCVENAEQLRSPALDARIEQLRAEKSAAAQVRGYPDDATVQRITIQARNLREKTYIRIEPCDIEPISEGFFSSPLYRAFAGPYESAAAYCAASPGIFALSKRINIPFFKFGVTESAIDARMDYLNAQRYGSLQCYGDNMVEQVGFDQWYSRPIVAQNRMSGSPVRVVGNCLKMRLPIGFAFADFDSVFRTALINNSLPHFLFSERGIRRCHSHGYLPEQLLIGTKTSPGEAEPYLHTWEIVRLSPVHHGDVVADVIERIIARFVRLEAQRMGQPSHLEMPICHSGL